MWIRGVDVACVYIATIYIARADSAEYKYNESEEKRRVFSGTCGVWLSEAVGPCACSTLAEAAEAP